jgi:serine/threonine protein kinase
VDRNTRIPVKVWITKSREVSIDFPTLRVGEGSFKIANLGIAYSRLAENRSKLLTVNARLQVEHVNDEVLTEIENEIKVQNEMAKGSRVVKISHLLGDASQPDMIRLQSEYYDHGTLKSFRNNLIKKSPAVTSILDHTPLPRLKRELGLQMLEQLAHIHSKQVCHRDIKPDNILVRTLEDGKVEAAITDFGLAKELGTQPNRKEFNYSGTPGYASPETFRAWNAVGRSPKPMRVPNQMSFSDYCLGTDVWATGLTLYSLTENKKLQCNPYQLDQVVTYDDLCARCQAFCEPGSKVKTRVPDANTYESVVYQMLDPNQTTRITAQKALQLMKD